MCGIAGFYDLRREGRSDREILVRMTDLARVAMDSATTALLTSDLRLAAPNLRVASPDLVSPLCQLLYG